MLAKNGAPKFDRKGWQQRSPMSTRFLLQYGQTLSPRILRYHVGLLLLSTAPHWRYAAYQQCARFGGAGFVRFSSRLWNRLHRT